jgi:hypothetical protein
MAGVTIRRGAVLSAVGDPAREPAGLVGMGRSVLVVAARCGALARSDGPVPERSALTGRSENHGGNRRP